MTKQEAKILSLVKAARVARKALKGIDSFAWSACRADCDEAHVECMKRINACRAALAELNLTLAGRA